MAGTFQMTFELYTVGYLNLVCIRITVLLKFKANFRLISETHRNAVILFVEDFYSNDVTLGKWLQRFFGALIPA